MEKTNLEFSAIQIYRVFWGFQASVISLYRIIPIKIWGLTEFAVNFLCFFGILTVFLTYFLTKEIFFIQKIGNTILYLPHFF